MTRASIHRLACAAAPLLLLCAGSPATAQTAPEWRVYTSELAKQCPDKQLPWMSPGELSGVVEGFTALDTPAQAAAQARAADVDRACAHVEMGATCGNFANLRGFIATRRLQSFVAYACVHQGVCHEQSDCDGPTGPVAAPAQSPKLEPR